MIKKLLFCILLACGNITLAETIKTDILVIGGSASGTSAAIQGARSKLKTLLIEQGPWLGGAMTAGGVCILDANKNLPSGIFGEFRKRVSGFYGKTPGYDTTYNATLKFEPYTGAAILKAMTDTVKNLTVKYNTDFLSVKKDGTGWDVVIRREGIEATVKTKVLIDATEFADAAAKAGVPLMSGDENTRETGVRFAPEASSGTIRDITWVIILKDYGRAADHTIKKPKNYNPALYACLKTQNIKKLLADAKLPNDKYLINWPGCGNTYNVAANELATENRQELFKRLRLQTLGLIYFLQTEMGLKNLSATDEFGTPDKLPYMPYVREYHHAKGLVRMILDDVYNRYGRESKLYRTAIGVGDAVPQQILSALPNSGYQPFPAYSIPLGSVVVKDFDNLIVTEKAISVSQGVAGSTCNPAVQMILGQGAGAVAAYCAFFKTTTKNFNAKTARIVQGELLDFKAYLLPFSDIDLRDPDFRAVQQVAATGLLQGRMAHSANPERLNVIFAPDSIVRTAEIQPLLTELYTRGFLLFNKIKPGEYFTTNNLLTFISEITLRDAKPLQLEIQKQWQTVYKFKSNFDLSHPVTRREFAVLANKFLNPFARYVDITGRLVN